MSTALLENTDTAARLERLAARRAEQAPPDAPTAKGTKASAMGRKGAPTNETKITALIASIATTGGLAFLLAPAGSTTTATSTIAATPVALQTSAAGTATANTTASSAAAATATSASTTVTGAVETNRFGNVQVSATFDANGALTSVTLLQQPGDNHSVRINNSAVPTLTAEAIAAQSANINSVSGATYTSNSYVASLQAAIDTARAQGITTLV